MSGTTAPGKWDTPLKPVEGRRPNRLVHSTSPYLLQHAYNPVDWYPWGEEAFGKAKKENKPIFLSIGYSACHWCHVMEHESFDDAQVAETLNRLYVPIKVDREERPDLDAIYMTAVQLMTGAGGWPMTVFLTPELRPFFGGTYFPKEDRYGRPGLLRILHTLRETFDKEPQSVAEQAEKLTQAVRENSAKAFAGEIPPFETALLAAANEMRSQLDPEWGGFGGAPKFPRPVGLELLLRAHARTGQDRFLEAATLTLDKMALGGLYDQAGGGFHRYSVDERWLVPHFEKMLYDNAQLASVYLSAWQVTKKPFYRRIVTETLEFILRDLADPATGAFYSTLDADSGGEEGSFYVWTPAELKKILGEKDGAFLAGLYDVTERGNFEHGTSILHLKAPLEEKFDALETARIRGLLNKLLSVRGGRVHPLRDDKVLTAWNALAVSAFAQAGFSLNEPRYVEAARRAADFLLSAMRTDGELLHVSREGKAHTGAYLDDHAYLLAALLDLYEATFDPKWIREAKSLAKQMIGKFWDTAEGGFFSTDGKDPTVFVRSKEVFDNATPAPGGVATHALARLSLYTGEKSLAEKSLAALKSSGKALEKAPSIVGTLLFAYEQLAGDPKEIAIAATGGVKKAQGLLDVVRGRFLPGRLLAFLDTRAPGAAEIAAEVPLLAGRAPLDGKAAAYVCKGYVCRRPVSAPGDLEKLLDER